MKKFLSNISIKIFKDKDEYHHDLSLKDFNERFKYIKDEYFKMLKEFSKYNFIYFLKFKKLYLLKLISLLCFIVIIVGLIGNIILHIAGYKVEKEIKPKTEQFTVYIPDTDTTSQKIAKKRGIQFHIFYIASPKKDWDKFKKAIANIESGTGTVDPYKIRREGSEYWGKYQMGELARHLAGCFATWEEFSNNPEMQEGAFRAWINFIRNDMKVEISKFNNTWVNGYHITESGIVALAHNLGSGGARSFLYGTKSCPSPLFLQIGGYNLNN